MFRRISPLLPLLLVLLVASCSGNRVRVLAFSPTGEVEPYTTFQIDFSEPLAPEDKIDQWLDEEYVTFEPAIKGKFKWITPASLIFSPEGPLTPGKDYSATVTEKVMFGKQDKKSDFETFSFHSPYFDVKSVELFWDQVPRSDYKVTVHANLQFNYEVDPAQLPPFLEVSAGGQPLRNFQVITKEPSSLIAVDFGQQQQTDRDQKFKVTVKSGLKSIATEKPLADNRSFDLDLPAITRLAVTSVASGFDGTKGWIEIHTTQPVDDRKFESFIELSPSRKFIATYSDNVTRMEAAFDPGSIVELTVRKGLPGLYGGKMDQTYTQSLVMADLAPKLSFADDKGQYLMRGGEENIKVNAVNIEKAEIKIWEVYDNNLLFYLYQTKGGYYSDHCCGVANEDGYSGRGYDDEYYDEGYEGEYYDDYYYGSDVGNYGKLLHTETIEFANSPNRIQDFTVNLSKYLDKRFRGIYVVELRDDREYWRGDVKAVSVSNLGLIAKRSADELMVFVNEISTTNPVAGAEVVLISTNNQPLMTGRTDGQGVVHFKNTEEKIADFTPRLIAVKHGEDFNFLDFAETEVGLSRFEVGGKHEYSHTYDTYLYADRNLFRPGETAHFNAIVRNKELAVVREIPVVFKVTDSRGKQVFEARKNLGSEGSAEVAVPLPDYSNTGDYILELSTGDKQLLSTYSFSVEEFVPDKIRVEAESPKTDIGLSEEISFNIFSEYLFGTPCAGHAYEVDISLNHQAFTSKKYKDYNFMPQKASSSDLSNDLSEGTLDEQGKATMTWTAPADITSYGIVKGRAYVTVFDATGRTVSRIVPFNIQPNDYFLGVKQNAYYAAVNAASSFSFVAVNSKDAPLKSFPAELEVIRYEWRTVLTKNNNDQYFYNSQRVPIVEKKTDVTLPAGPMSWSYVPTKSGEYEVRIRKRGEERYTSATFYAYGFNSTTATSFGVDREGRVEIIADKEKYAPGETAKLLFKAPFSGKMLVTIERERVMEHFTVNVENNSAELSLPITDRLLPNIFVSATLIRPHKMQQTTPFFVGHGYLPIRVEKASNRIPVQITAPERIKPRTTQEIIVKAGAGESVHVTLAMVDEGILQIKNYRSPDPYAYMYANRKLSVSNYDLYDQLLEEAPAMGSSVAGGDESGARLNPITAKRFKLLSFWSGERKTDGNGEARIAIQIPQFNGAARLMAVAYSGERFGGAEKMMNITDDVVVMPALPRFLSPMDSVMLPVSLLNTTAKSGNVTVTVKTSGPLSVTGKASQSIAMKGKDNKSLKFGIKAGNAVGEAKIIITTTGLDNSTEDIEIAVRPTSPLVVEEGYGMIAAGETKNVKLPGDFIASTQTAKLSISKFPALKYAGHLEYLVGYPHGCLEQTTSRVFPQIYLQDLVTAISPKKLLGGNPVYFVNEGIAKLQTFQQSDGGLGYWNAAGESSWWGSVYAAHFLVEAKKAGFKVPESLLNDLLGFIVRRSSDKGTYNYATYTNNKVTYEVKAYKEAIYSLYVMAAAGRGDLSTMNYYRARPHMLTSDTRYLLAGAFAQMNNWAAYRELLPEAFLVEHPVRQSGGNFDSEVRANAIVLNVLMDVDPNNKQIPGLVRYLSGLGDDAIYSTQDRAWTLLGLGKAAGRNAKAKVKVDASIAGKSLGVYDNNAFTQKSKDWGGKTITLKASGEGSVYYFWSTEGVKSAGDAAVAEVDNNLKVRRKWRNREGKELGPNDKVRIGDLVVCQIEVTTGLRSVENLAISDLIPAGFEIENPRLGESTSLTWIKPNFGVDHLDVRDDRVLLFGSMAASSTNSFYYMARAVNAGKFRVGPIGAEAMYDPEFRSYHGARWLNIEPR